METKTLMIIGLGAVGTPTLEMLAQSKEFNNVHDKIIACDIDDKRGASLVNVARAEAYARGLYPNVEFVKVDLRNLDEIVALLDKYEPDLIFFNAALMSPWITRKLPIQVANDLTYVAGSATVLPIHLLLLYNLMLAVQKTGLSKKMKIINASYPDITNTMLTRKGLGTRS